MADDAIASHNLLRRLIESKQGLMNKSLKKLKDYSGIQQLYPKSAIANHRLVFWFNSLKKIADAMSNTEGRVVNIRISQFIHVISFTTLTVGVPWSAALDHIKNIKEEHEAIVQSEDNSTGGSRQRLIKAKNGYLCSAIDEPREGLQSKLRDLKKRRADEAKSFKDPEMRQKALELSFEDIKTFMDQNQDSSRLVFLIIIKLFFKNYSNSLNMEEFVKAGFHIVISMGSFDIDPTCDILKMAPSIEDQLKSHLRAHLTNLCQLIQIKEIGFLKNLSGKIFSPVHSNYQIIY